MKTETKVRECIRKGTPSFTAALKGVRGVLEIIIRIYL